MKTMAYQRRSANRFFRRTYTGAELDYVEEAGGTLAGVEFKWGKKWRKQEPDLYKGQEAALRFLQLLCRAIAEEMITVSKGAELYNMKTANSWTKLRIIVHDLSEEQWREIEQLSFSRRFSEADQSVLGLAYLLRATILTNEKLMRRKAGQWGLEVHGILWLLESFVNGEMLSPQAAAEKLEYLMKINIYLPQQECKMRLEHWGRGGDDDSRS